MRKIQFDLKTLHKVYCMEDFFIALGLLKDIKDGKIKSVKQMQMCRQTNEDLLELCKQSSSKCPKLEIFNERTRHNVVGMDWLCYSPETNDEVPQNEIWILTTEEVKEHEAQRRTKENGGG